MSKEYTPSPWERPENYEEWLEEHPPEPTVGVTLKDYIETQLSVGGFYVEEFNNAIKAWSRSGSPENGYFIFSPVGDKYAISSATGVYATKKNKTVMGNTLTRWINEFKAGAR